MAEEGYVKTSLEKIADRAGYTKGAVYSNFSSKEELTLAVLDDHFSDWLNELQRRLAEVQPSVEERVDALVGWWEDLILHERWGVVILELAGATRDRPAIQEALSQRQDMIISFCAYLVQHELDQLGLEVEMSSREIAETLVALGTGLAFARSLDREVSAQVLSRTARALFLGPGGPVTGRPRPS